MGEVSCGIARAFRSVSLRGEKGFLEREGEREGGVYGLTGRALSQPGANSPEMMDLRTAASSAYLDSYSASFDVQAASRAAPDDTWRLQWLPHRGVRRSIIKGFFY